MTDPAPRQDPPAEPEPYVPRIDRRTALAWTGAAAVAIAAAGGVGVVLHERKEGRRLAAKGYGTDPNLLKPVIPWPRIMTKAELQTTALVCDFILPASPTAPSASAVGVPDFLNEWVSAPYPEQSGDRPIVLDGLRWLEEESQRRFGADLFHAKAGERHGLLQQIAAKPADPRLGKPHDFFKKIRALTIGAYYTTDAGFKDIGYIGNTPRQFDPGPSPEVIAALERQLKTLGL